MSRFKLLVALIVIAGCSSSKETIPPPDSPAVASSTSARRLVTAYVDAWNRHDSAAIDSLLAPDGTHEDVPSGFVAKGPAGVHGMMRGLATDLPDYAWTITDFVEGDPKLAFMWTWQGHFTGKDPTGKTVSNRPVKGEGASLVIVEGGRIKHIRNFYDEASLFRSPAK